ncbi:aminotransferase class V-fold PLP-dependent enzyme [Rhodococcus sp. HNM0569]|nr:aminotransferase class V-fold PLP-dependent enzyme [Rhodococcus sp. HNM0569]NLU82707.1 aminotransferase class V-fold PLP-dependent enzyme [Rhodococcus sp. HNM0569]
MRPTDPLDAVRADTPGCRDVVFLDSAGSSLAPEPVVEAQIRHLRRETEVGGYLAAAERVDDLAAVKVSLGRLLGTTSESIALTDSATRAWNDFLAAVPLGPGDRVLLSQVEYSSNAIAALSRGRAVGASVEFVPGEPSGRLDLAALDAMLDERVRLVSIVHAPTNSGLLNPVREAAALAHRHGALVLLDACQSMGQVALDVHELDVDALSATGRKWLRGPRGTGLLYVRPELRLEPAAPDMRGAAWTASDTYATVPDATRFELWESDIAARLGLGAAADYLLDLGVDAVAAAVGERAEYLRAGLDDIPGVTVRDPAPPRSGIVSFTVDGVEPDAVRERLRALDVVVTVSVRGSTLLDMTARGLDSVVRASAHYFCSEADLDTFLSAVRRLR